MCQDYYAICGAYQYVILSILLLISLLNLKVQLSTTHNFLMYNRQQFWRESQLSLL